MFFLEGDQTFDLLHSCEEQRAERRAVNKRPADQKMVFLEEEPAS
jgi:DNA-directed RNA polymerase specialized sigma24 family protein